MVFPRMTAVRSVGGSNLACSRASLVAVIAYCVKRSVLRNALGGSEVEHQARARHAPVLERELEALRPRASSARGALEFGEHASQRKCQRIDALGLGGKLEARAEARRRRVRQTRIGGPAHEPVERQRDLRPEALCDAGCGQCEDVAEAQDAEVREMR